MVGMCEAYCLFFFFFNDTATTEIYTLSLHDALPIYLTYYRIVKGIRDTMEMYASARPTIDYRSSAPPDSAEPYVIVADRVRFKGNDRMWGGGKVTIDRSDVAARGDSMQLDQAAGLGVLVGKPHVAGQG